MMKILKKKKKDKKRLRKELIKLHCSKAQRILMCTAEKVGGEIRSFRLLFSFKYIGSIKSVLSLIHQIFNYSYERGAISTGVV